MKNYINIMTFLTKYSSIKNVRCWVFGIYKGILQLVCILTPSTNFDKCGSKIKFLYKCIQYLCKGNVKYRTMMTRLKLCFALFTLF